MATDKHNEKLLYLCERIRFFLFSRKKYIYFYYSTLKSLKKKKQKMSSFSFNGTNNQTD